VSGDDVGRTAAYAAEDAAFGGTDLDAERAFDDLVGLADDVTGGPWWARCGGPVVRVEPAAAGAASSSARAADGGVLVRLAAGQRTSATLTHELAHALAGIGHGHDARFRAAHVDVAALVGSAAAGRALAAAYAAGGVPAGRRRWPSPVRVIGDGFAIIP
jgi:hypothetical protein